MNQVNNKLNQIEERNKRVELDKAWEQSKTRRTLIAVVTYAVAAYFLYRIGVEEFYLHAFVPMGGYIFSTLTLTWVKQEWLKKYGS